MEENKRKMLKKANLFYRFNDASIAMSIFRYPRRYYEAFRHRQLKNWTVLFSPVYYLFFWALDCIALSWRFLTRVSPGRMSFGLLGIVYTLWLFMLANIEKDLNAYGDFFNQLGFSIYAAFSEQEVVDTGSLITAISRIDSQAMLVMMGLFFLSAIAHFVNVKIAGNGDKDSANSRGTSIAYKLLGEKTSMLSERYYDIAFEVSAAVIAGLVAFVFEDYTFAVWLWIAAAVIFWQESFESINRSTMDV